jgi:hypothetical protein
MIIRNQHFRKARLLILDLHSRDFDHRLLGEAITNINLYVSQS